MKHILVYGTLRSNSARNHNHNRFGKQRHIKDLTLTGFNMHDLRYYPAICKGAGTIKAELHEVNDMTYQRLVDMEIGANYTEQIVQIDDKTAASIFVMTPEQLADYPVVPNGDWA